MNASQGSKLSSSRPSASPEQRDSRRDGLSFQIAAHGWTSRFIAAGIVLAVLLIVFAKLLAK